MKKIALLLFFISTIASFSQEKKTTKTGIITFEASVPSFEEVKATHKNASCILNTQTGEIAALALIKGFRFKVALMEEHFNENYIESDKFPKAIFKGKIIDFNLDKITSSPQKFTIKGTLELHGKTKEVTSIAIIKKENGKIEIKNDFKVNVEDFNIEIPSVVSKKLSKDVTVDCHFIL